MKKSNDIQIAKGFEAYTKNEVCDMLKIKTTALETLMRNGKIGYYKIGGSVRFLPSDIENYLRSRHIRAAIESY